MSYIRLDVPDDLATKVEEAKNDSGFDVKTYLLRVLEDYFNPEQAQGDSDRNPPERTYEIAFAGSSLINAQAKIEIMGEQGVTVLGAFTKGDDFYLLVERASP